MKPLIVITFISVFLLNTPARSQETVFALLKSDTRLADEYYRDKNYKKALRIYAALFERDHSSKTLPVKVARCLYFMKDYARAVGVFQRMNNDDFLSAEDQFYYGEALAATGNYKKAIQVYNQCLAKSPGNEWIIQKIWRLNNIKYLYEDSLHYVVRPISLNTRDGELSPVPLKNGLIFISNRKYVQVVEKIDGTLNQPFYNTYISATYPDTINNGTTRYRRPSSFQKGLFSGLQAGPMSFYQQEKKLVYTSSGSGSGSKGVRKLQLFFAEEVAGHWEKNSDFPYNSTSYSITDPTMTEDGTTLYFSSDMPGGFGGKDIYRCTYKDGNWSKPENLSETVNTPYDEVFPYIHLGRTLYFSSNGHPGLGGLDIFKVALLENRTGEVENIGYPINTKADEFGIIIDSLSAHGYFTSNRKGGGYDDDIYEFDMDFQPYPLALEGWIRFRELSWSDSTESKPFANVHFYLIDNLREITVQEGTSDENGHVTWTIPYFSKYHVRLVGPDNDEHIVSLEIPRNRQEQSRREIVIVKDAFR